MESVKDVLGKWGKKAAEATKKAEDLAGNMWQHCEYCYYNKILNYFWLSQNNCNVSKVVEALVFPSYFRGKRRRKLKVVGSTFNRKQRTYQIRKMQKLL